MKEVGQELVMGEAWVAGRVEERAEVSARRDVALHCDVEPGLRLSVSSELTEAFRRLLDFVLATVPDGCPVSLEVTRPLRPLAAVGSGQLAIRWQTSGPRRSESEQGGVTTIHPLPGDARSHLASDRLHEIYEAFEAAGWKVEVEALSDATELFVRATSG